MQAANDAQVLQIVRKQWAIRVVLRRFDCKPFRATPSCKADRALCSPACGPRRSCLQIANDDLRQKR